MHFVNAACESCKLRATILHATSRSATDFVTWLDWLSPARTRNTNRKKQESCFNSVRRSYAHSGGFSAGDQWSCLGRYNFHIASAEAEIKITHEWTGRRTSCFQMTVNINATASTCLLPRIFFAQQWDGFNTSLWNVASHATKDNATQQRLRAAWTITLHLPSGQKNLGWRYHSHQKGLRCYQATNAHCTTTWRTLHRKFHATFAQYQVILGKVGQVPHWVRRPWLQLNHTSLRSENMTLSLLFKTARDLQTRKHSFHTQTPLETVNQVGVRSEAGPVGFDRSLWLKCQTKFPAFTYLYVRCCQWRAFCTFLRHQTVNLRWAYQPRVTAQANRTFWTKRSPPPLRGAMSFFSRDVFFGKSLGAWSELSYFSPPRKKHRDVSSPAQWPSWKTQTGITKQLSPMMTPYLYSTLELHSPSFEKSWKLSFLGKKKKHNDISFLVIKVLMCHDIKTGSSGASLMILVFFFWQSPYWRQDKPVYELHVHKFQAGMKQECPGETTSVQVLRHC